MRIRFGLGLPGPFVLTGGGRRPRPSGSGLGALFIVVLVYLGAWFKWPLQTLVVHAAVVVVLALVWLSRRGRRGRDEQ